MNSQPTTRTFQILTLAACGMACLLALLPAAGHDQMWLLYAARLHLAGATLYGPQLFETNPPLGIWLSSVPELLARILHLPDTAVGKLLVTATAVVIPAWCLRLLRPIFPAVGRASLWWLAFVWVCLAGVMPARDFGQRDHLLAMLVLPYLCAAAVRPGSVRVLKSEALLIGVAAGIGICLKPHQALIPIAVELLLLGWFLTRRTSGLRRLPFLRPEIAGVVATGATFVLAVRLWAPRYFTDILPLARDTYWAFHQLHFTGILTEATQLHVLILTDLAVALTLGWRRIPRLVAILLAAGAGATAAYYLQGTGWYYQQLPALTFFGLALAFLLLEVAATRPALTAPRWTPAGAAALAALALVLTAHFMDYPFTPARSFTIDTPDPSFFAGLPAGTPVATLTTTVDYTVPPVFRYHLVLAQRYPHLWLLPAILRNEDPTPDPSPFGSHPAPEHAEGAAESKDPGRPSQPQLPALSPTRASSRSRAGSPSELGSGGEPAAHPIPSARLAELDALQHRFMAEDLDRWQPRLLLIERCQDSTVHCQVLEDRHDNLLAWFLRDPAFRARFAHYRYWRSAGSFDAWVRID